MRFDVDSLKKNIVVIKVELDPNPLNNIPIEATMKLGLIDRAKFPNPKIPYDNKIEFLRPKLSLKYGNPINPKKIPKGKQSLARFT